MDGCGGNIKDPADFANGFSFLVETANSMKKLSLGLGSAKTRQVAILVNPAFFDEAVVTESIVSTLEKETIVVLRKIAAFDVLKKNMGGKGLRTDKSNGAVHFALQLLRAGEVIKLGGTMRRPGFRSVGQQNDSKITTRGGK